MTHQPEDNERNQHIDTHKQKPSNLKHILLEGAIDGHGRCAFDGCCCEVCRSLHDTMRMDSSHF